MMRVEVTLQDGSTTVVACLDHRVDLQYPLMSVLTVVDDPGDPSTSRAAP